MATEPSPAEILAERISDKALAIVKTDATLSLFLAAAAIAVPCVLRAGEAGNVQCQRAVREMQPFLDKLIPSNLNPEI